MVGVWGAEQVTAGPTHPSPPPVVLGALVEGAACVRAFAGRGDRAVSSTRTSFGGDAYELLKVLLCRGEEVRGVEVLSFFVRCDSWACVVAGAAFVCGTSAGFRPPLALAVGVVGVVPLQVLVCPLGAEEEPMEFVVDASRPVDADMGPTAGITPSAGDSPATVTSGGGAAAGPTTASASTSAATTPAPAVSLTVVASPPVNVPPPPPTPAGDSGSAFAGPPPPSGGSDANSPLSASPMGASRKVSRHRRNLSGSSASYASLDPLEVAPFQPSPLSAVVSPLVPRTHALGRAGAGDLTLSLHPAAPQVPPADAGPASSTAASPVVGGEGHVAGPSARPDAACAAPAGLFVRFSGVASYRLVRPDPDDDGGVALPSLRTTYTRTFSYVGGACTSHGDAVMTVRRIRPEGAARTGPPLPRSRPTSLSSASSASAPLHGGLVLPLRVSAVCTLPTGPRSPMAAPPPIAVASRRDGGDTTGVAADAAPAGAVSRDGLVASYSPVGLGSPVAPALPVVGDGGVGAAADTYDGTGYGFDPVQPAPASSRLVPDLAHVLVQFQNPLAVLPDNDDEVSDFRSLSLSSPQFNAVSTPVGGLAGPAGSPPLPVDPSGRLDAVTAAVTAAAAAAVAAPIASPPVTAPPVDQGASPGESRVGSAHREARHSVHSAPMRGHGLAGASVPAAASPVRVGGHRRLISGGDGASVSSSGSGLPPAAAPAGVRGSTGARRLVVGSSGGGGAGSGLPAAAPAAATVSDGSLNSARRRPLTGGGGIITGAGGGTGGASGSGSGSGGSSSRAAHAVVHLPAHVAHAK